MSIKLPEEKLETPPIPQPPMGCPFEKEVNDSPPVKTLIYGDTGTGKTSIALEFENCCVLDCERGTTPYAKKKDFHVLHTTSYETMSRAVDYLSNNHHGYQTLIIDPVTVLWESLQAKWIDILMRRNKGGKGHRQEFYELSAKDWGLIKADLKSFFRKLMLLDVNLVLTAREKVRYKAGSFLVPDGSTFDGEKSIPYLVDSVVRTYRDKDGEFLCEVIKDRTGTLPKEDFPTEHLVGFLTKNAVHRKSNPIKQISEKQILTLNELLGGFDPLTVKKSLAVYNVERFEELSHNQAEMIIAKCLSASTS
jgi:hypothetical protein